MVLTTAARIALALLFANLLIVSLRGGRFYRVCFFIPMATSLAAISVVFLGLLMGHDSGVNKLMVAAGIIGPESTVDWLGDSRTALLTITAVTIWHGLPYTIILILAGLQSIPPELYEAASIDGAGPLQRFRHVTIPELLPILIVIAFNSLVNAARAMGVVWVLTEGGSDHSSELGATYIFKWGFTRPVGQEPDVGYASALGIVYAAVLGILIFANVYIISRRWKRRLAPAAAGGEKNDAGGK
jgi:raffinose/stachyose/melibiose transport system permease protein